MFSSVFCRRSLKQVDISCIDFKLSVMQVTAVNIMGYLMAFGGVCWYNLKKMQTKKMATRQEAKIGAENDEDRQELIPAVHKT